ncbi:MAG: hypothetical protein LBT80_02240 [Lactobacillaceae bacterium]|jgi:hypothetical protein|nr:hypothetical protein [Lactobacillaceae bacterium]
MAKIFIGIVLGLSVIWFSLSAVSGAEQPETSQHVGFDENMHNASTTLTKTKYTRTIKLLVGQGNKNEFRRLKPQKITQCIWDQYDAKTDTHTYTDESGQPLIYPIFAGVEVPFVAGFQARINYIPAKFVDGAKDVTVRYDGIRYLDVAPMMDFGTLKIAAINQPVPPKQFGITVFDTVSNGRKKWSVTAKLNNPMQTKIGDTLDYSQINIGGTQLLASPRQIFTGANMRGIQAQIIQTRDVTFQLSAHDAPKLARQYRGVVTIALNDVPN